MGPTAVGVFLPLRDPSPDTCGGGRSVLDPVKGTDLGGDAAAGRLVVNLNFAHNPSCAYSPRWSCPLARALAGGERYAGH